MTGQRCGGAASYSNLHLQLDVSHLNMMGLASGFQQRLDVNCNCTAKTHPLAEAYWYACATMSVSSYTSNTGADEMLTDGAPVGLDQGARTQEPHRRARK